MVHCGSERPVALLLDNHDSHYSLKVIEMARENQVWVDITNCVLLFTFG